MTSGEKAGISGPQLGCLRQQIIAVRRMTPSIRDVDGMRAA